MSLDNNGEVQAPVAEEPFQNSESEFERSGRRSFPRIARAMAAMLLLIQIPGSEAKTSDCENPSPEDISTVSGLLEDPADTYNKARMDKGHEEQAESGFSGDYTQQALVDINSHAAGMFGLKTHDYLDYVRVLRGDMKKVELPFDTYFGQAEAFASLYGIELVKQDPDFVYSYPEDRVPQDSELETVFAKTNMTRLIENLGLLPVEYVQLAGLKKIVLTYSPNDIGGYAISGTYVINIKHHLDRRVFAHELYHLADSEQCGDYGMHIDPAFRAFNGRPVYVDEGIDPKNVTTDEDVYDFYNEHLNEMQEARESKDKQAYCQLENEGRALNEASVTKTEYGLSSAAEDKAELFSDMLDTQLQEGAALIDKQSPIIFNKSVFLLARLYKRAPNIARYFIQVNAPIYEVDNIDNPDAIVC